MKKFLFLILVLLQLSAMAFQTGSLSAFWDDPDEIGDGTNPVNELHSGILYSILSLRFDEADSMLKLSAEMLAGDPYHYYLENYLVFLDALISGDRKSYEAYLQSTGSRINHIRGSEKDVPETAIYLSSIHLQSSLLCAYHGENFLAARHFYHARRFLRQSEDKGEGGALNFRNRGLITLGIGALPEEYDWLLTLFGIEGEIDEGLGYLDEYLAFSTGAERLEACLIFHLADHMVYPGENDIGMISGVCWNDSLTLFQYAGALTDLASRNSNKVVKNLGDYQQTNMERAFPYIDLVLGEAMLNRLDTNAYQPLERFVNEYSGEHYRHYAWHRLSWVYLLSGDKVKYQMARQKVLDSGEAKFDADRQALSEARDTLPVNIRLLKARLLFDGGNYWEAMEQLKGSNRIVLQNRRDSVEYDYRVARIYHSYGDRTKAEAGYMQVLAAGTGETWYYAPNAALQLGKINEERRYSGKALWYYRRCLKINKSAYKSSIDYKAQQGIRRLDR